MGNKRGQVTIFIIIAIVIVALVALFFILAPSIGIDLTPGTKNPQEFIQTCMEDEFEENIDLISMQGGSLEPDHAFLYDGYNVSYLCYSSEYYNTCVVQEPLLYSHAEEEIESSVNSLIDTCFNSMRDSFENDGYSVTIRPGWKNVEILPEKVLLRLNYTVILTKVETEEYSQFDIFVDNNLYELIGIANSIIEWESEYGGADPTVYMAIYEDLKVEKYPQSDDTTIYILTDKEKGDLFQLASRSLAFPAGY